MKYFTILILAIMLFSCSSNSADIQPEIKQAIDQRLKSKWGIDKVTYVKQWQPDADKVELSHYPEGSSKDVTMVAFKVESSLRGKYDSPVNLRCVAAMYEGDLWSANMYARTVIDDDQMNNPVMTDYSQLESYMFGDSEEAPKIKLMDKEAYRKEMGTSN